MLDPRALFRRSPGEDEKVDGLLELLHLTHVAKAPVAALPLGVIRLVEVGRALASEPRVLLLDEPLSGLDLHGSENLITVFRRIVDQSDDGLSLVIVEHDVAAVLALSNSVVVLDFGQRIAVGTPEEVRSDPAVRAAYLGDAEPPKRATAGQPPPARRIRPAGGRRDDRAPARGGRASTSATARPRRCSGSPSVCCPDPSWPSSA